MVDYARMRAVADEPARHTPVRDHAAMGIEHHLVVAPRKSALTVFGAYPAAG